MEAFFVVALALIMVGLGAFALLGVRRVAAYRNNDPKDPQ